MKDLYSFKPVPLFPIQKGLPIVVRTSDYDFHDVKLDYIPEEAPHYTANEIMAMYKGASPDGILMYFGFEVSRHGEYFTSNEELKRHVSPGWFLGFVPGTMKSISSGGVIPEWGSYSSDEADSYTLVPPSKEPRYTREIFSLFLSTPIKWSDKEKKYKMQPATLVVRPIFGDVCYQTIRCFML